MTHPAFTDLSAALPSLTFPPSADLIVRVSLGPLETLVRVPAGDEFPSARAAKIHADRLHRVACELVGDEVPAEHASTAFVRAEIGRDFN